MEDRELPEMSLIDAITARRSCRGQFQDKPIRSEDLDLLLEAARWAPSPFNVQPWELLLIRETEGKGALADLTEKSVAEQFKDTKFLDDNRRWMRLSEEEWEESRDGVLLADHVNLPQIVSKDPTILHPLVKNAKHLGVLGHLGAGKMPAKEISSLVRTSPLLILVLMNTNRRPPGDGAARWMWIGMGAMIQNLMLAATALHIGTQFVSAPLERKQDRERVRDIFNLPAAIEIVSLLRLGYLNSTEGKSVRLGAYAFTQFEKYKPAGNTST
ncbi:MAG: nitroreductase family protein [Candidatus Poribacteria bacterium]|nr:nitroreductase family protein [Candidatus Poribacteria bacterium]MDE0506346.1 nitroreductase family protein [Candidatus Poribacteria bacterium]